MSKKIQIDRYIMYGLNRRRNFLTLPRGDKIKLPTPESIKTFAKEAITGKECECAVFFAYLDGTYSAVFKTVKNQEVKESMPMDVMVTFSVLSTLRQADSELFAKMDGDFRFCCYSLLFEVDDGIFEVCKKIKI